MVGSMFSMLLYCTGFATKHNWKACFILLLFLSVALYIPTPTPPQSGIDKLETEGSTIPACPSKGCKPFQELSLMFVYVYVLFLF